MNVEHTAYRLGSSPSIPAYSTVFSPKFKASFSSKPNQIPTLGIRMAPELKKIGFNWNAVSRLSVPATSPRLLGRPEIDLTLHSSDKTITPQRFLKSDFRNYVIALKIYVISIPTVIKWATEFRQPSAINAGHHLFGCLVPQASSMRNFTLSCLPWTLSEDLKKNNFSFCQTHIPV